MNGSNIVVQTNAITIGSEFVKFNICQLSNIIKQLEYFDGKVISIRLVYDNLHEQYLMEYQCNREHDLEIWT